MPTETKKTLIAQIHKNHYTFVGKSFKPNQVYKDWCSATNNTLALSRLNITELRKRCSTICVKCLELDSVCQNTCDGNDDDKNTCVCGDIACDDWDKTPRDNAPEVPELPYWIVEQSKIFKQKALMKQMLALDVKMMELDALFQKC